MESFVQYAFAFMVFSALCISSESDASRITYRDKSKFSLQDTSTSISEFRYVMQNIILESISHHEGGRYSQLFLLFDEHFEDEVQSFALAHFTTQTSVILTYRYDSTESQLKNLLRLINCPTILLLLCSPMQIIMVFQMIRFSRLASHQVHWILILENSRDLNGTVVSLEDLVFEGTQVTLALPEGEGKFSLLSSLVDNKGIVRFTNKVKYIPNQGFQGPCCAPPIHQDLEGRKMRVTAVNYFGLCNLKLFEDGTVKSASGVDFGLIDMLSQALNFSYRVVTPANNGYGNPMPNGTVTGMVGMLARREAEIGTCSIHLSSQRSAVVDFPYPFFRAPFRLISRSPKEKDRVMAIFSPFTFQVWLCLIASVLLVGSIATLQSKLSEVLLDDNIPWGLQDYTFNMFRSCMVQSSRIVPFIWSLKLTFFFWFLFCLITSSLYSGLLIAVLTVPTFETPIDFLQDLPKAVKDDFTIGTLANSANYLLFKEAESGSSYGEIWRLFNHKNPDNSFVETITTGMSRVLERKYVYIGYEQSCEIVAARMGKRNFHFSRESLFSGDTGLAVPPGAPYTKSFSKVTLRVIEGGFRLKWNSEELRRQAALVPKDSRENSDQTRAFTLRHLQAAFFLVVIGLMSSAMALVFEMALFSGDKWKDDDSLL